MAKKETAFRHFQLLLIAVAALSLRIPAWADVRLPNVLSDNVILRFRWFLDMNSNEVKIYYVCN